MSSKIPGDLERATRKMEIKGFTIDESGVIRKKSTKM